MPCPSLRTRGPLGARRIVIGGAAVLAALGVGPVSAASATVVPGPVCQTSSIEREACSVDGFVVEYLPAGLGSPSDFEYEWENVVFHSRVWETGPDPEGATKVDLSVKTIRGERLIDVETLREFLTEYHEKNPDTWELTAVKVGDYGGYLAADQVFYFISPGVAAEVTIDRERFTEDDLLATAGGFSPGQPAAVKS